MGEMWKTGRLASDLSMRHTRYDSFGGKQRKSDPTRDRKANPNSVFWHQDLRQALTSNSTFIIHHLSPLDRNPLIARYAKLACAFFLSGVTHIVSDGLMNIPFRESGALFFFSIQAVGIMVEDAAQAMFRALGARQPATMPSKWLMCQRMLGYTWVILFLTWSTPFWSYPIARQSGDFPLPVRFFQSFL